MRDQVDLLRFIARAYGEPYGRCILWPSGGALLSAEIGHRLRGLR